MTTNINPANIDSNYPIAGQDNDSQGFRTNFTVIKNNLTSAASEITDLQNKAILKSPLLGTTEVNNDLGNTLLTRAVTRGFSGAVRDHEIMTGPVDVLFLDGPMHKVETSGPVTLKITWPTIAAIPTVDGSCLTLRVWIKVIDVAHTMILPALPVVLHGTDILAGYSGDTTRTITFEAIGDYLFEFSTANGGNDTFVIDLSRASASVTDLSVGNLVVTGAITGELATAAQPNITSVGTLTSLDVSGAITGTFEGLIGGTVPAAGTFTTLNATAIGGALSTATQPNITSVGTLTNLTVAGAITGVLATAAQPNITSVGTLTSLDVSGAITGVLATAAQPNITSVGTLTSLGITNALSAGAVTTGNAIINGGLINNTSIGGTTPGNGTFSKLVASTTATLPVRTPTAIGLAGDEAGMIVSDAANLYVCTGTHDGATAIWKKLALSPI